MKENQINRTDFLKTSLFNLLLAVIFYLVQPALVLLPLILQSYAIVKRCRDIKYRPYFPLFLLWLAFALKAYLTIYGVNPEEFFNEMRQLTHFTTEQNRIGLLITVYYLANVLNLIYLVILLCKKSNNSSEK